MADSPSSAPLNDSMDGALKHYSSLFSLPTYRRIVLAIAVLCIGVVGLSTYALFSTTQSLINSLVFGVTLFVVTFLVDVVVSKFLLKEPLFVLRRTAALSLFCWVFWGFFLFLGMAFGLLFDNIWWWFKLSLLGFGAVLTLRFIVLFATSSASFVRQILSVLLLPYLGIGVFFGFWFSMIGDVPARFLLYLLFATVIAYVAVFFFLRSLDEIGKRLNGVPALPLFKAFMLNWVIAANDPLEVHLEKMGENTDIDVTMLRFDSSTPKAAIIVPLVHPGPFKNIGSSLLPPLLKKHFEEAFGCQTCTPLGLLGHELDLASQAQNFKVITQIIEAAKFEATETLASPFVQVSESCATVSCQVFGDTVFLSFSLSPKTTEDLPQELGQTVQREARKYGLKCTLAVNCHNSITDVIDTLEYLPELEAAAFKCLQKVATMPKKPFKVGSSTIYPPDFTLKEGMGTGGITAITVQVEDQRSVYIVIDGNNMISGCREKVLLALNAFGFTTSEVFTTDTHAVSALSTGSRGYHPVGEVINQDKLIHYIVEAANEAAANLEPAKAGCKHIIIPQVRVIGSSRIESLSVLVDQGIKKAKQMVIPVFLTEGLLLFFLLAFL